MSDTLGRDVVHALDLLLAERPEKVGNDFSDAVRRLVAWREHLVLRWRNTGAEGDRMCLERVNAAISVLVGGQFPLGPVPWSHIERARQDMAALADAECS